MGHDVADLCGLQVGGVELGEVGGGEAEAGHAGVDVQDGGVVQAAPGCDVVERAEDGGEVVGQVVRFGALDGAAEDGKHGVWDGVADGERLVQVGDEEVAGGGGG